MPERRSFIGVWTMLSCFWQDLETLQSRLFFLSLFFFFCPAHLQADWKNTELKWIAQFEEIPVYVHLHFNSFSAMYDIMENFGAHREILHCSYCFESNIRSKNIISKHGIPQMFLPSTLWCEWHISRWIWAMKLKSWDISAWLNHGRIY